MESMMKGVFALRTGMSRRLLKFGGGSCDDYAT
jgi:hypothetical protein